MKYCFQEFCKGLTNQSQDENAQQNQDDYQDSNASDGQPSAKRVRPLLETPVEVCLCSEVNVLV